MALTISLLFSAVSFAVPVTSVQDTGVTVAFALGQGQGDKLLDELKGNLTSLGYTVVDIYEITDSALEGVDVFVLGAVYGATFTSDEIEAIANWFDHGEKGLWVAGDSDYGPPAGHEIITNMNDVLEAVGSQMRIEPTSVEDPESNAASAYRVVGNVVNRDDPEVLGITAGVTQALFHGPTILYGVDADGNPVELGASLTNVFPVISTSTAGVIVDHDLEMPLAHEDGQVGSFVLMAAELVPSKLNKIIAAGASPYGDYQPICSDEYKGVPLKGMLLIVKSIVWLATTLTQPEAPAPPPIPGFPLEAIMLGIAMTAAALYLFRKKAIPTV